MVEDGCQATRRGTEDPREGKDVVGKQPARVDNKTVGTWCTLYTVVYIPVLYI